MALVDDLTGHFADHEESVLYVNHGATAGTARPTLGSNSTAAASVVWVGSVEPTNATSADQWYDTANEVWKHKASGSFVTVGNGASPTFVSGRYYGAADDALTATGAIGTNIFRAHPLWIPSSKSFDRISVEVTTASTGGGGVIRLGIYDDAGGPSDLILDAGTVSSETAVVHEITISQSLTGMVWVGCVPQTDATNLQMRTLSKRPRFFGDDSFNGAAKALFMSAVTGALPATFTVSGDVTVAPLVELRAA